MPKRSRKPRDLNQLAKAITDQSTDDEPAPDPDDGKDPAAVALGRKGGKKGGKARASRMYYNFARPHKSLANPYPRTPAMAAGGSAAGGLKQPPKGSVKETAANPDRPSVAL